MRDPEEMGYGWRKSHEPTQKERCVYNSVLSSIVRRVNIPSPREPYAFFQCAHSIEEDENLVKPPLGDLTLRSDAGDADTLRAPAEIEPCQSLGNDS